MTEYDLPAGRRLDLARRFFEERFTSEKEIAHLLRLYRVVIAKFKAARVQSGR